MRKNNFKLFVIFGLILFLAVGYAVVNSVSLTVSGSSSAGTTDLKVYFNGNKTLSNSSKLSVDVLNGSTSATFVASDVELNENVSFLLEVVNNEIDVPAKITITTNGSNDFYTVYSDQSSLVIQPGETKQVGIFVNMKKTPITSADSVANFTITLDAVPTVVSNFITFTVDGKSYQAENNMTWEMWETSIYNTDGIYTSVNNMCIYEGKSIESVTPFDTIIEGTAYRSSDLPCKH